MSGEKGALTLAGMVVAIHNLNGRIMQRKYKAMNTQCTLGMGKEIVPFFSDETAFIDAVFGKDGENWQYFVRVLARKYRSLVEQEREIGRQAPLGAGWYVPVTVLKARRAFEVAIGSCDAQDIILDAIKRCTHNPALASFYRQYTPRKSAFRTWFVSHLRSCAGVRIGQWRCRKPYERRLDKAQPFEQRTSKGKQDVDTFLSPPRPAFEGEPEGAESHIEAIAEQSSVPKMSGETVEAFLARGGYVRCVPDAPASNFPPDLTAARDKEMGQWRRHKHAHTPRAARKEPWYHPEYRTLESRLDLKTLATACLTDEEQHILAVRLSFASTDRDFAHAIGCSYAQARSKVSYIIKKIKNMYNNSTFYSTNSSQR
jgi:hypothetical protein